MEIFGDVDRNFRNALVIRERTYEEVLAYLQAGISDKNEKPTRKRLGRKPQNEA